MSGENETVVCSIGERLRLLREEHGYSQSEFADKMNVNRMTINNYENLKRTPDIGFALKAARHFGVTLEYLTGKSEFRNREDLIESVKKSNGLMCVVEKLPQTEGQQMIAQLAQMLETAAECEASMPILIALTSCIAQFDKILSDYIELEENIVRNVGELRWQKIQPALIQWTCLEKSKALSDSALSSSENIFAAMKLLSKMLNKKLVKTLELESEK